MKYLKTFLIAIVLIFSFFFIGNVKALTDMTIVNKCKDFIRNYNQSHFNINYDNNVILYDTLSEKYFLVVKNQIYNLTKYMNNGWNVNKYNNNFVLVSPNWYFFNLYRYDGNDTFTYIKQDHYLNITGTYNFNFVYSDKEILNKSGSDFTYNGKTYSNNSVVFSNISNEPITFNFHLNGGWVRDPRDNWGSDEDFSMTLYLDEIDDFFINLEVNKLSMVFDGFYFDKDFEQQLNMLNENYNDHIYLENGNQFVDLYAKWRYKSVDDFLANTNFNEYTFDTDYDYAIINRGNNNGEIYIKLPFKSFELEIYEYNENTNTYKDGASVCLVPIFNKNGWYIYNLNTLFTTNQEVLILPKYLLEQAEYENPEEQYKFYLTDNAYISYTNDLKHTIITNSNGDQIDTNLQNSYDLSEQYKQLYNDEKNIYAQIKIFLNQITKYTTVIKDLFQYLFNSLNSTIRSFIIFLAVLILISTIIKFIRRG